MGFLAADPMAAARLLGGFRESKKLALQTAMRCCGWKACYCSDPVLVLSVCKMLLRGGACASLAPGRKEHHQIATPVRKSDVV